MNSATSFQLLRAYGETKNALFSSKIKTVLWSSFKGSMIASIWSKVIFFFWSLSHQFKASTILCVRKRNNKNSSSSQLRLLIMQPSQHLPNKHGHCNNHLAPLENDNDLFMIIAIDMATLVQPAIKSTAFLINKKSDLHHHHLPL